MRKDQEPRQNIEPQSLRWRKWALISLVYGSVLAGIMLESACGSNASPEVDTPTADPTYFVGADVPKLRLQIEDTDGDNDYDLVDSRNQKNDVDYLPFVDIDRQPRPDGVFEITQNDLETMEPNICKLPLVIQLDVNNDGHATGEDEDIVFDHIGETYTSDSGATVTVDQLLREIRTDVGNPANPAERHYKQIDVPINEPINRDPACDRNDRLSS